MRWIRRVLSRGKVTAIVALKKPERSVFGITVILHRRVREFQNVQVFLSMPWGMEYVLPTEAYTLIKLTDGAFPGECKASISAYLTRQGLKLASQSPEGAKLILRFRTSPRGRGGIEVTARRPLIYSKKLPMA